MNNSELSPEVQFGYLICWFREFSEYERSDFMDILIQWLLNKSNEAMHMNGISHNNSKPSIFYCRMKLFREWSLKWNDSQRSNFVEKLNEIDSDFILKMNEILESKLEEGDENGPEEREQEKAVMDDIEKIQNGMIEMTVNEE